MKITHIWPGCPLDNTNGDVSWRAKQRNAFWVISSIKEAEEHIVPLMNPFCKREWKNNLPPTNCHKFDYDIYNKDYNGNAGFLITDDLSRIMMIEPGYPTSSMWCAKDNPFKRFYKEISSLEELRNLL